MVKDDEMAKGKGGGAEQSDHYFGNYFLFILFLSQVFTFLIEGVFSYGSVAPGRDFWATNEQKVQHVGTSGNFIFEANHFLSTHPVQKWAVHG